MSTRSLTIAVLCAGLLDLAANILAAHLMIPLPFGLAAPGGTLLFALAFTLADVIRRQGGLRPTIAALALGFAASQVYSVVWGGTVGAIAVAGLVALTCSSSADLIAQTITLRWPIWRYVVASNGVSLFIDSVVFTSLAFGFSGQLIAGQYLAKMAMTLLAIPLVYLVRQHAAPRPALAQIRMA